MAQSAAILKSSLAVGSSGVSDIVEDTSPQLGGDLDVNGNSIVSTSNGNIAITPNGSGSVVIDGLSHPQADGTAGQVLQTDGEGNLSFADSISASLSTASSGSIDLDNSTTFELSSSNIAYNLSTPSETQVSASDAAFNDNFGFSVAMSADGSRYISGAYYDLLSASGAPEGSAYIFTYNSGTSSWDETKITASDAGAADEFGKSVAISGDGLTVAVGAYSDDDTASNSGSVYVYKYNSGTSSWDETKINASDAASNDGFGSSVALDSNGDKLIVGAWTEGTGGSAYIYTYSGSSWGSEEKITSSDVAFSDKFGYSVSISDDGTRVIVGAYDDDDNGGGAGTAFIFDDSGSGFSQTTKLTASDGAASDVFGHSVSISGDGNTVAVGARGDESNTGAVYIFKYNTSTTSWDSGTKLTASDGDTGDYFGNSVSLNENGELLVIGAPYQDETGASSCGCVYYFTYSSSWSSGTKILNDTPQASAATGVSVGISDDGTRFVTGSNSYDLPGSGNNGSSFVYDVTVTKPISISNGTSGQVYTIVVTSDGFSYSFNNTNLYWPNNSAPTPSAEDKKDIYSIVKVGSNYYGSYAFNYN